MRPAMDRIRCRSGRTTDHGNHRNRRNAGGKRHRHLLHPRDFLRCGEAFRGSQACHRIDAGSGTRRLKMRYAIALLRNSRKTASSAQGTDREFLGCLRPRTAAFALLALFSTACARGPNYHRPAIQVPEKFRAPEPLAPPKTEYLADLQLFAVFKHTKFH